MSDRYLTIYRDGSHSFFMEDYEQAERTRTIHLLKPRKPGDGHAYRIRIREKAQVEPSCGNVFVDIGLGAFYPLPSFAGSVK